MWPIDCIDFIAGAWSDQNILALIGEDRTLTVSNKEGDTLCQAGLKGEPCLPQFACLKLEGKGGSSVENCVSLVLNRKTLYLFNMHDAEAPLMLNYGDQYGLISSYTWYGDGLILVAFSSSHFLVVATQAREVGQELLSFKAHKENLTASHLCVKTKRLACCTENM